MKEVKKQEKLKKKLSLNKETITNLNQIRGGRPIGLTEGEYTCNGGGTCFCPK